MDTAVRSRLHRNAPRRIARDQFAWSELGPLGEPDVGELQRWGEQMHGRGRFRGGIQGGDSL
jgi:hypothetical protein